MRISRRSFLRHAGVVAGGATLLTQMRPLHASPMNQPLGFQTFEIIPHLILDWKGTWKAMAGFGYKFADLVQFGSRPQLAQYSAKDVRRSLNEVGLTCTNGHFSYNAWAQSFAESVQYAHDLGLSSVVCALGPRRSTIEDWKWMGGQLNEIGAKLQKEGLQLAYHNHEIEFRSVQGQVPWDILMASTDPALVRAQLDVGNLTFGGGDAIACLSRYKERVFSLHCKDFAPGKASVPVGQGILDWNKILSIAKSVDIKSYVCEVGAYGVATLDGTPLEQSQLDVLESFRQSFVFLNAFQNA